jgi:ABC-type glycerol-3-phosphate transport system substrate-binding protein
MAGTSQIGGSLTATYMASGTYDAAAKDLIAAFEAKYGTKVTVAAFPWMGLVGNNAKDLITGAGNYDVMSGAGANLWAFLEPLDPYIQRDGYEEPFVPGLLDKMPHFQGALLGLPYGCDSYGMAIRTDLFEEAGIKVPQEAWTWDEFDKNVAELHAKFKDRGISGFVLAGGAVDQLGPFFWGRYDGYHWSKDGALKHDEALSVAALERLKLEFQYCPTNVLGLSIDEANAVFLAGNACVLECWPSFIRGVLDDPNQSKIAGKWAFMPYPTPGFDYLSVWPLVINKASKNKEAAWQWLKAYVSREADKTFFEKYGFGLAMTSTYEDPGLKAKHSGDFPASLANLSRAKQPVVPDEAEFFLGQVVSEAVNGTTSFKDAIAKLNEKWASIQGAQPEYELAVTEGLVQK